MREVRMMEERKCRVGEWQIVFGADGFAFFFFFLHDARHRQHFHPFSFPLAIPPPLELLTLGKKNRTVDHPLNYSPSPTIDSICTWSKTTPLDPSLDIRNRWRKSKRAILTSIPTQPNQQLRVSHPTTCLNDVGLCQV